MCAHYVLLVFCMPVAVDYSVADRFLPEPCGGSNSKEKLQTTVERETANNCKQNRKAKTEA